MSKRSKSKRFIQQSTDSIKKYEERIPYYSTMAEREARERHSSAGNNFGGL